MVLWSPLWLSHRPWCYVTRSLRCLNAGPHARPACAWHSYTGSQPYHPHMIKTGSQKMQEKKANSMRCIPLVLPNCLICFRICIIWMTTEPRIERYADSCTSSDLSKWNKPAMNHFIPAVCGCNASVASTRLKMPPRNSQSLPPSPLRFPSPLLTLVGQAGVRPSIMQTHTPSDWQKHRDVCKWVQAGRPCAGE